MTTKPSSYSVNPPYDYVEAAITYIPGTYWKSTRLRDHGLTDRKSRNGNCAYGTDGQLLNKVDLRVATGPFTVPAGRTDCAGGTSCTLAEEKQNFANWFQYYRKRHPHVAALGNAFDGLHGLRAGFFQFSNVSSNSWIVCEPISHVRLRHTTAAAPTELARADRRAVQDHRQRWRHADAEAMDYIGQEYKRTDAAAPITNYCQFNAGFVITDGFANGAAPSDLPVRATTTADAPSTTYPYNKQYNTNATR